ncbi:hypothetical protein [Kitasatospora purpeofusca]|uniref:hypothetical protein n=1 Tax=Kitasatospora purpeofusca TaxID=67352 RepID=UPI002254FF53|nr:hypothetical protein [Kitasatospora purpeofusca]MCX4753495.1 hypothetical protein [Kitasatospora purpeofusca]WSR32991.1 hypothetical protein OG715_19565 [Kitasatospora purpeofusca]WSR41060.1 hypothetical protein OG196_19260 [Kitasatospora purpeofusca]
MRFSKRAGAMLLAVGAGMLASQGAASAAPVGPEQVGALEEQLATQQVPVDIPLAPLDSRISGGIPTSLLMPPVPAHTTGDALIPERIVPPLGTGRVGPTAKAELPLPLLDQGADLGELLLDAPAAPLHADTPGIGLGKPLALAQDGTGQLADGRVKVDEIDPRLVTGAVQAVPGASATLGNEDERISVTDSVDNLATTTTATTTGVVQETGLAGLAQL